jgi:hypothetical protein
MKLSMTGQEKGNYTLWSVIGGIFNYDKYDTNFSIK